MKKRTSLAKKLNMVIFSLMLAICTFFHTPMTVFAVDHSNVRDYAVFSMIDLNGNRVVLGNSPSVWDASMRCESLFPFDVYSQILQASPSSAGTAYNYEVSISGSGEVVIYLKLDNLPGGSFDDHILSLTGRLELFYSFKPLQSNYSIDVFDSAYIVGADGVKHYASVTTFTYCFFSLNSLPYFNGQGISIHIPYRLSTFYSSTNSSSNVGFTFGFTSSPYTYFNLRSTPGYAGSDLAIGYDSSTGDSASSEFGSGVAELDAAENSLFNSSTDAISDFTFFDIGSVPAITTGVSFVSSCMAMIFDSSGGLSGAGVVMSISLCVLIASVIIGIWRYWHKDG